MTKTLNQIIFFCLHQNQNIFFQQHWESEYFFRKKPDYITSHYTTNAVINVIERTTLKEEDIYTIIVNGITHLPRVKVFVIT